MYAYMHAQVDMLMLNIFFSYTSGECTQKYDENS